MTPDNVHKSQGALWDNNLARRRWAATTGVLFDKRFRFSYESVLFRCILEYVCGAMADAGSPMCGSCHVAVTVVI